MKNEDTRPRDSNSHPSSKSWIATAAVLIIAALAVGSYAFLATSQTLK